MAAEIGYIRTDGNDFPLQRQFTQAFDRVTGARPNPAIGAPGGYYVDSSQTMLYNGLQTSLRRRFSDRYSWDVNYTLSESNSTQGGDLSVYYITSFNAMQDFWNPELDYGPSTNDIRHRFNASFIYELPGIGDGHGVLNALLGGWQISGIVQARSGGALIVTQPSGIGNSRLDVDPSVDLVVADWHDTASPGCNCSNLRASSVSRYAPTNATPGLARSCPRWCEVPATSTCTRRLPRASLSVAGRGCRFEPKRSTY